MTLAASSAPEPMDWTATGRSQQTNTAGAKPRATWVSVSEIKARKAKGSCIRCGQPGHRIPTCLYDPPIRPVQVAEVMTLPQEVMLMPEVLEETEELNEEL